MTLQEIEHKKEYLKNLRSFTLKELEIINFNLIKLNVHSKPIKEELEGLNRVYSEIEFIMKEESSFPYPSGYRHPLTEEMLQSLNRAVLSAYSIYLPCEKGFYRIGKGKDKIGEIILPNKEIFITRLKELISWYEETNCDLISKLAIFHLKFLCDIHPFYDGNGRTARAFMNLELARDGFPMIALKYSNSKAYANAFDSYINQNDVEPMKRLILENINTQLDNHITFKNINI